MGPVRNGKQRQHDNSSAAGSSSRKHQGKVRRNNAPERDLAPGLQKIKASLRQTRRLLAKDNLASDVRVASERRLKSLEADLARAELAQKERTMATKYHMVKFFEKQKVTRKLLQTKKRLAASHFGTDSKEALQHRLAELRVDLNYIQHYPKTKKYVSLFPPEVRQGEQSTSASTESAKTQATRIELREWVRECMSNGEFPAEPELLQTVHGKPKSTPRRPEFASTAKAATQREAPPEPPAEVDDFFVEDGGDSESDEGKFCCSLRGLLEKLTLSALSHPDSE